MTREEAKEYAKEMTYRDAINNLMKARSIPYRKATFIKVNELLKALEQEPTVAQERYEDLCEYFGGAKDILNNREDFKAWLGRIKWHIHKAEELYEKYEQEPKTGHWIITYPHGKQNPIYECPHCHASNSSVFKNFCPHCGARMVEPQKSEDENDGR